MQIGHLDILSEIIYLRFTKVQNIAIKRNNFIIL